MNTAKQAQILIHVRPYISQIVTCLVFSIEFSQQKTVSIVKFSWGDAFGEVTTSARLVDTNAMLICRSCKWVEEAILWQTHEVADVPLRGARIDLATLSAEPAEERVWCDCCQSGDVGSAADRERGRSGPQTGRVVRWLGRWRLPRPRVGAAVRRARRLNGSIFEYRA